MNKDNQRIMLTKRMLKNGLLSMLKTKELDKINITELCKESGINRATFYRHYEVPRDILKEMQVEFVEETLELFSIPLAEKDMENFFAYLLQNADLVKLFIRYNSDEEWVQMFKLLYQNCFEPKAMRELDPVSHKLMRTYLAGGAYFLLRQWLMEDIQKSPKEIAAIVLSAINKEYLFLE